MDSDPPPPYDATPAKNPEVEKASKPIGDLGTRYMEFGSPSGLPVIFFHGLMASNREASLWDSAAKATNIRIISPARHTSDEPAKLVADYPQHIAKLVEQLGLESYHILAISMGTPYALACAAQREKLPGLQSIASVSTWGPPGSPHKGMSLKVRLGARAVKWLSPSSMTWVADKYMAGFFDNKDSDEIQHLLRQSMGGNPQGYSPDRDLYHDPDYVRAVAQDMIDLRDNGSKGNVHDVKLITEDWGFSLGEVKGDRLTMWCGEDDEWTPPAMCKAVAEQIPGVEVRVVEKGTHSTTGLKHMEEILKNLRGTDKIDG